MKPLYKLPDEFMAVHGHIVKEWDWRRFPTLSLAEVFPDIEGLHRVRLHFATSASGEPVVRPLGGGSANLLAKYCNTLPQFPKPTRAELAAVLAKKNPPKDQQQ